VHDTNRPKHCRTAGTRSQRRRGSNQYPRRRLSPRTERDGAPCASPDRSTGCGWCSCDTHSAHCLRYVHHSHMQPTFSLDAEWNACLGRAVGPESQDTALDWWRENEQHFPRVALGARYLLAIPATSVTSERVFSKAVRTISNLRARMTGVNAEQFIVLHDDIARRRRMERARGDSA